MVKQAERDARPPPLTAATTRSSLSLFPRTTMTPLDSPPQLPPPRHSLPSQLPPRHSLRLLPRSGLLSDRCYGVRQEAAVAYGARCAVVCSIPFTSNGRQNHGMPGSLVDRFIGWALPLLSNISAGDGTPELALDGLREFLNIGDVGGIERYALSILKACQVLVEDERTSLSLLHRLLGVLTFISLKFSRCLQPHFLDIVDLLLGWALVPDLAESDRRIIMDSFLQFQNH